jgi:hypothetical protein
VGVGTAYSGYRTDCAAHDNTHHIDAAYYDDRTGSDQRAKCNGPVRSGGSSQHACWKSQHDAAAESDRPADANHDQSRRRGNTKRATKRDDTSDAGQYSGDSVAMRNVIGNDACNEFHWESIDRANEYDGNPHQRTYDGKSHNRKLAYSEFRHVRYGTSSPELNKPSFRQYANSDYAPESNCSVPFWHGEHW